MQRSGNLPSYQFELAIICDLLVVNGVHFWEGWLRGQIEFDVLLVLFSLKTIARAHIYDGE